MSNCLAVADSTMTCLLYTSDAADERSSVDLGGRRIIKKKHTLQLQSNRNHSNITTQQQQVVFKHRHRTDH